MCAFVIPKSSPMSKIVWDLRGTDTPLLAGSALGAFCFFLCVFVELGISKGAQRRIATVPGDLPAQSLLVVPFSGHCFKPGA